MLASFKKGTIGGVKVHVDRLQVCGSILMSFANYVWNQPNLRYNEQTLNIQWIVLIIILTFKTQTVYTFIYALLVGFLWHVSTPTSVNVDL